MVLLPNILFSSLLTNYRSPLTAHKIALPSHGIHYSFFGRTEWAVKKIPRE
jgi:hypothetical protein